jgi:hypothetical protein
VIIDQIMCRAIDVLIAIQKAMWETKVDGADFIRAIPLFVAQFSIEGSKMIFELLVTTWALNGDITHELDPLRL